MPPGRSPRAAMGESQQSQQPSQTQQPSQQQQQQQQHHRYTWGKIKRHKPSKWFRYSQIIAPLLPIPVGCYLLYKAIVSFNRNPPPIATDSKTVLSRPLYQEPIYQRVSFAPSTIARAARSRLDLATAASSHVLPSVLFQPFAHPDLAIGSHHRRQHESPQRRCLSPC